MRIIPQINVFTVNFQVKIIMGLFDDASVVFANGRLYKYHLYIYVSDDVEALSNMKPV